MPHLYFRGDPDNRYPGAYFNHYHHRLLLLQGQKQGEVSTCRFISLRTYWISKLIGKLYFKYTAIT